ncbi:hypothetical protein J1605_015189 [Eschrichtius robustus]|uniref:Uncharacterized protein n=1 Tax=Eschrichtius robustus TaxID=9764 RepID=A0AB34GCA8_ESCRO|nr:hypothetical protein J1605_015189 [Eschrichtius robustus]
MTCAASGIRPGPRRHVGSGLVTRSRRRPGRLEGGPQPEGTRAGVRRRGRGSPVERGASSGERAAARAVASSRPVVPSSLPLGARDEEVEDGEGPAGLPSARRPLPATLPRRCGDSYERGWSAALGPAPASARRRRRSPPAPSREVGEKLLPSPGPARPTGVCPSRRYLLALCLGLRPVHSFPVPPKSDLRSWERRDTRTRVSEVVLAARRGAGEVSFGRSKEREQRPLSVPGVGGLPVGGRGVATVPGERAGDGGRAVL